MGIGPADVGKKGPDMMVSTLDRSAIAQALAKAIAYKNCGKDVQANVWAIRLVMLLGSRDILADLPAEYSDTFGEG